MLDVDNELQYGVFPKELRLFLVVTLEIANVNRCWVYANKLPVWNSVIYRWWILNNCWYAITFASIRNVYISNRIGAYIDGRSLTTSLKVNHRGHLSPKNKDFMLVVVGIPQCAPIYALSY